MLNHRIAVPTLTLALGAVVVAGTAVLLTWLVSPGARPEVCRDQVHRMQLAGPQNDIECHPGARASWRIETVGTERWVVMTCECSPGAEPDAGQSLPDASK